MMMLQGNGARFAGRLGFRLCLVLCLTGVGAVWAQAQTTGTILGVVTDPSGAVVAGATVTVTNVQTGLTRNTKTSALGAYTFPLLPAGQYSLTIEALGFEKYFHRGLELQVEQQLRVDVPLKVGKVAQGVVVSGQPPQINTSSPTLGKVVGSQRIVDLPLNGRDFLELGTIQAGVVPPVTGITVIGSGTNNTPGGTDVLFSVNGMRYNSNNFLLDGVNNIEPFSGAAMVVPAPDAIQEFRILTNMYSAEYGRSGGSIVTVLTKSGTNMFHGDIYEFLRNDIFDARNFFAPKVPKLTQNQFGFTFGGPVVKNNTFFMGSYEGFRQVQGFPTTTGVPSLAERSGDFSEDPVKPINPETGQPFSGGIIPPNQINSVGQALLNFYPPPNLGTNEWTGAPKAPNDRDQFLVRLDHQFLQGKNSLMGRYALDQGTQVTPVGFFSFGNGIDQVPGFSNEDTNRFQNLVVGDTAVLSATKLNEFRFSYQRARVGAGLPTNVIDRSTLGFTFPIAGTPINALPDVFIPGLSGLGYPQIDLRLENMLEFADNVTWESGRHNMKFGADIQRISMSDQFPSLAWGGFDFLGSVTGNPVADALLGIPTLFLQAGGNPIKHLSRTAYYLYGEDSFRVVPRLNLTFGLRYELAPGFTEDNNLLLTFKPGVQSVVRPDLPQGLLVPGDPGIPSTLFPTQKDLFAPRIGLAWDPWGNGKTSVRAGYGVFYDQDSLLQTYLVEQPPDVQPIIVLILPTLLPTQFGPPGTLADPYAGDSPFTSPVKFPLPVPPATTAVWTAPDFVPAYVQQWNLTLERQLTRTLTLEVSYVGNKGTHLQGTTSPNQAIWSPTATRFNVQQRRPFPQLGESFQVSSVFNSNYNGLQITATQRSSHGLTFEASYTYSKALDDTSAPSSFFLVPGQPRIPQNNMNLAGEYGPSAFDMRHRFVMSYIYDLPFFKGSHGFLFSAFGGWRMSGITTIQSGMPFTVIDSSEPDLDGSTSINDRVNVVGDPNAGHCPNSFPAGTPNCWVNTTAFAHLTMPNFGNEGRNALRADGIVNFDFGLAKEIPVHEQQHFELRWEIFNLFNAPNFAAPVNDFNSRNFGQVQSTSTPGRIMQIAAKFVF